MKFLQKLGKSLMLPVCVLPVCGILMGIGYLLCPASMQGGEITGAVKIIGFLLVKAGGAIIDNMAILFAIGVAVGMSDDGHGTAVLAGIVSWLMITSLLSVNVMSTVYGGLDPKSTTYVAFSKVQNPTIGIIAGLIGAFCYNKFKNTKLPDFLAFFSGKRSVAIVTALFSLIAAAILAFLWPLCFGGLVKFGSWIASLGGIGAGIYAFLNRLLIPTGMHHALNNVFWFDTIGIGDLKNFWAGKTSQDVGWSLGMYMSGFFPCMMGGIPGAALAIIHCAKNKKKAMGVLFSTAFCSFLCGVTEPFEFSFMFMCFPLYVVYCLLYGIFTVITYYVQFRAGFSFSAGLVDLAFSSSLPAAQNTWLIIPLAIGAFVIFYLVFRFAIKKFNLPTIGREEEGDAAAETAAAAAGSSVSGDDKELAQARGLLKAVGGKDNVTASDCCATRLRLDVKDSSRVDKKLAKQYGAIDVICPSGNSCQVIIGVTVQQVLEAFRKAMEEPGSEAAAGSAGMADRRAMAKAVPAGPVIAHGQTVRILLKRPAREIGEGAPAVQETGISGGPARAVPVRKEADGTFAFTYEVRDPSGIHARPAGQIAQIVKNHSVKVTVEACGKTAAGSSPVEMMGLGVKGGTEIAVKVSGEPQEAEAVANELGRFICGNL